MGSLLDRAEKTIRHHDLLAPDDRVLVALSGGPDSVCLLHVLRALGYPTGAAHLDHLTRHGASTQDAAWVREWTARLGVECHVRERNVTEEARAMGVSFEEHARATRYAFLVEIARSCGYTAVATGHHAGDQAETVLMRLLRGASGRGLSGIPYRREQNGVRIVRPLLDCQRDAILEYLEHHGLEFRMDVSNTDERYFRNRVRCRLLPELARDYNHNLVEALSRTAALLHDDDRLLGRMAAEEAEACGILDNRLDRNRFSAMDRALQGRVLLLLAWRNGADCDYGHIREGIEFVCNGPTGRQCDLGSGFRLRTGRRFVYVESDTCVLAETEIACPGTTCVGGRAFLVSPARAVEPRDWRTYCTPARQVFDADALHGPLTARPWRAGDRFTPFGMTGTKKLQDYFVDAGVSVPERNAQWLLLAGGRIAWIVGRAIDAHVAVTAHTRRIVEVEVFDERDALD